MDGTNITLSMSDMQMLIANEKVEDTRHLREVVVHPDGMVTGDWMHRDRRGAFSEKEGFSVVAPMRIIVPSST